MPDEAVLEGIDPYDVMDVEAARLDAYFSGLDAADWERPSACEGWTVKDLLAHLAGSEEYNHACLDDAIPALFERLGKLGAADMDSFNQVGVEERADRSPEEVLAEWREACARTRRDLRARDGGDLSTSVGPYPVRWQAFHLASELATHADDISVPVTPQEAEARTAWRRQFARFVLTEMKPDVELRPSDAGTHVAAEGAQAVLSDDDLVAATNGRLGEDHPLLPSLRSALNVVGS
jgi:uncharacterized protein (TIGR03083 family)